MQIGVKWNETPQRALSLWEKYQIAEILSQFPALTLKVVARQKVGLRRAEPAHVFIMGGMLYGVGNLFHSHLAQFGIAVIVTGCWQHRNRWKELREGQRPAWHTLSEGVSLIESYVMPRLRFTSAEVSPARFSREWWLKESRIYRRLDPLAAFIAGAGVYFIDQPLGYWIMFAAACLACNENLIWRHQLTAYLNWHDHQIDAGQMRGWKGGRGKRWVPTAARPRSATNGLPTGIGEDIRERVEAQAIEARVQRFEKLITERQKAMGTPFLMNGSDNLVRK